MLEADGFNATDLITLRKTKGYLSTHYEESRLQLGGYQPLLGVAVGTTHPLYDQYRRGLALMMEYYVLFQREIDNHYGRRLGPILVVHFFSFHIRKWFEMQSKTTREVPVPDLVGKVETFLREERIFDFIPPYNNIVKLANYAAPSSQRRTEGGTPHNNGSTTGTPSRGAVVNNPHLDSRFNDNSTMAQKLRSIQIGNKRRELLDLDVPICCPLAANGRERCLLWHAKGVCRENCPKADDHIELVGVEKENMHTYVRALVTDSP